MRALPIRNAGMACTTALLLCMLPVLSFGQVTEPPHVMLARLTLDTADHAITHGKVEAAMALAAELSARYHYVSSTARDSLIVASGKGTTELTAVDAARIVEARYVAFMSVRRLHHVLRTEIVLQDAWGIRPEQRGIGYAALRLHHRDESVLADPAILSSVQRAMAVAMRDSSLFADADSGLRARPTFLTAVGGIEFIDDGALQPWNLFKEKVAVSFDMVQTVIHDLASSERVTLLDTETRDTLYALFGLHLVENYNQVSAIELSHLRKFEVSRLITGTLQRTERGATLRLAFNSVDPNDRFTPLSVATERVENDSKQELRSAVSRAVATLLRER